jgi:hypothetical protein
MKRTKPNTRRNFLLAASLGGAGAAAALVAGRQPAPAAAESPTVDKPRGYHVSEHILKYYKTTQV